MKTHGSELLSVACELALEHKTLNAAVVLNHVNRLKAPPRRSEKTRCPATCACNRSRKPTAAGMTA